MAVWWTALIRCMTLMWLIVWCLIWFLIWIVSGHEPTLVHILSVMSLWCAKFTTKVPDSVIQSFKSGLGQKSTSAGRSAYIQCMSCTFKGELVFGWTPVLITLIVFCDRILGLLPYVPVRYCKAVVVTSNFYHASARCKRRQLMDDAPKGSRSQADIRSGNEERQSMTDRQFEEAKSCVLLFTGVVLLQVDGQYLVTWTPGA